MGWGRCWDTQKNWSGNFGICFIYNIFAHDTLHTHPSRQGRLCKDKIVYIFYIYMCVKQNNYVVIHKLYFFVFFVDGKIIMLSYTSCIFFFFVDNKIIMLLYIFLYMFVYIFFVLYILYIYFDAIT